MPRPAQLVHGGMARQAYDRCRGHPLDLDARLVERPRPQRSAARGEKRELEEPRSFGAPARAERGFICRLRSYEKVLDAAGAQDREDRRDLRKVFVEEMTDREALELHRRLVASRQLQLVRPEPARYVGQDTRAIAFAVDDA